jgi:hypothetical protein
MTVEKEALWVLIYRIFAQDRCWDCYWLVCFVPLSALIWYVSVDKKKNSCFGGRRGCGMGFELCNTVVLPIYHFVGKWKHTCHKGIRYAIPSLHRLEWNASKLFLHSLLALWTHGMVIRFFFPLFKSFIWSVFRSMIGPRVHLKWTWTHLTFQVVHSKCV